MYTFDATLTICINIDLAAENQLNVDNGCIKTKIWG